jgi:hypothetical protein
MKKKTFVPSADHLESRIALSGGIKFIGGLPVLTTQALHATYNAIHAAYVQFATHTPLNYNLLSFNLGQAVNRIPFNARDGLRAEVQAEVAVLHERIEDNVAQPVIKTFQETIVDVNAFVHDEVAAGIFILA